MHRVSELLGRLGPAVLLSTDGVGMIHVGRAPTRAPQGPAGPYWFLADAARVAGWKSIGQAVALTFHAPGHPFYITLQGTADAVPDQTARAAAWDSRFASWFPDGPTDARLALLEVQVTAAECVEWHACVAG